MALPEFQPFIISSLEDVRKTFDRLKELFNRLKSGEIDEVRVELLSEGDLNVIGNVTVSGAITSLGAVTAGGYSYFGSLRLNGTDSSNTIYNGPRKTVISSDTGHSIHLTRTSQDGVVGLSVNTTTGNVTSHQTLTTQGLDVTSGAKLGDTVFLRFGGTTAAFPALRNAGSTLHVRKADDSALGSLAAGDIAVAELTADGAPADAHTLKIGGNTVLEVHATGIEALQPLVAQTELRSLDFVEALNEIRIDGVKVVGLQEPARADTTGAAVAALETEVNYLKQLLRNHGLMAT